MKTIQVKYEYDDELSEEDISSEGIHFSNIVSITPNNGFLEIEEMCDGHYSCLLDEHGAQELVNQLQLMVNKIKG